MYVHFPFPALVTRLKALTNPKGQKAELTGRSILLPYSCVSNGEDRIVSASFFPFQFHSSRDKLQSRSSGIISSKEEVTRRQLLAVGFTSPLVSLITYSCSLTVLPAWAEDQEIQDKDESVVGAIKSLFDPNEKTKLGKVLPKAYLNSAREVVKTLRESLKEDPNDMSKFRRTADAAKDSIREYLGGWRGQKTVVDEESYVMLEKAIRSLASFYSKAGPSAALPEEIKSEILDDLNKAEEGL